jgi:hypothetical protein
MYENYFVGLDGPARPMGWNLIPLKSNRNWSGPLRAGGGLGRADGLTATAGPDAERRMKWAATG